MAKKLILDPILAHSIQICPSTRPFLLQVLFQLVVRHCSKLLSYAI